MEKGRQLLKKDNILDEADASKADTCETPEEKLKRIEGLIDRNQTRLARLIANFNAVQQKLSTRLAKLERELYNEQNQRTIDEEAKRIPSKEPSESTECEESSMQRRAELELEHMKN